jgi:hypothetical protein
MFARFVSWLQARLNVNEESGYERYSELAPIIRPPKPQNARPAGPEDRMWDEMEPEEDPQPARFRAWEGSGE